MALAGCLVPVEQVTYIVRKQAPNQSAVPENQVKIDQTQTETQNISTQTNILQTNQIANQANQSTNLNDMFRALLFYIRGAYEEELSFQVSDKNILQIDGEGNAVPLKTGTVQVIGYEKWREVVKLEKAVSIPINVDGASRLTTSEIAGCWIAVHGNHQIIQGIFKQDEAYTSKRLITNILPKETVSQFDIGQMTYQASTGQFEVANTACRCEDEKIETAIFNPSFSGIVSDVSVSQATIKYGHGAEIVYDRCLRSEELFLEKASES